MKKLVILFLLATLIFAQNPNVYSALGDVIYNNVDAIEKLKYIPEFSASKEKIEKYIEDVQNTKQDGFSIESGNKNINKGEYLSKLRELSKRNDFFIRDVKGSFQKAIQTKNNALFSAIVDSGLIDVNLYKQDILNYYSKHSEDLNVSGVMQGVLSEDKALKKRVKAYKEIQKNIQKDKVKRIRERDMIKQEMIKKSLEDEVMQKKKKIRENQQKELSGS